MKKNITILLLLLLPIALFAQSEALIFKIKEHDFGNIKEESGMVSCIFKFENQGKVPIIINAVQASCGCTTPVWTKEPVLPSKMGMVKVTYNPANRPGKFAKTITVTTSAGSKQLLIKGIVSPRPKSLSELYPKKMEQLRLTTSYVMFNEIGNKQQRVITVNVVNDSQEDVLVTFAKTPSYFEVHMDKSSLKPKEKGQIKVTYDASKTNFWGFNSDIIPVLVNGVQKAANNLIVTATVIEDFSNMNKEEIENAPVLGIDKFEKQFQSVIAGDKVKTQFKITNIGKRPLILHKIDTSSEALEVKIGKMVIQPNTQEVLDVTFDTAGKNGYQNQQITIITNVPNFPIANFRISGIVE